MEEAVIVATARTGIGRAHRGTLNNTHGSTLAAHVIRAVMARAKLEPGDIEDVMLGVAHPEGATGNNIARSAAVEAGLGIGVPGMTLDRKCASGLQTIVLAAHRIRSGEPGVFIAGGLDSVSMVMPHKNLTNFRSPVLERDKPDFYWPMIETADFVARKYGVSRQAQDEYSLVSQQRVAAAQAARRFDAEIVPISVTHAVSDKSGAVVETRPATLDRDEGNRADTTLEGLGALKPVRGEDQFITAGNASQLSDGASVCVVMSARTAS